MQRLKYYINVFLSSYAIASVVIAAVNYFSGTTSINTLWVFQMAFLCLAITILMLLTDILTEKLYKSTPPVWLFILLGIIEVSACVLLIGGLWYNWFDFNAFWILTVLVIDVIIYFAVFGVMLLQEKQSADSINKIIESERKKNGEDY